MSDATQARLVLEDCRKQGLDFPEAWELVEELGFDYVWIEPGWGETPLKFMHRHSGWATSTPRAARNGWVRAERSQNPAAS